MAADSVCTRLRLDPGSCRLVVVGAASSGFAALRLLHRMGAQVQLSEKGPEEAMPQQLRDWLREQRVPFECGGHSESFLAGADALVVSPGVPPEIAPLAAFRKNGGEIIGELGLAAALLGIPVIAITGTNGKTTVTQLINDLLLAAGRRVFMGGNIGTPLSEYLLGPQQAEIAVLEVSSFQLDTMGDSFRPQVALLLNITPDHLDRYPSLEHYAASKMRIFKGQGGEDAAIINLDDAETQRALCHASIAARRYYFGARLGGREGAQQGGEPGSIELTGRFAGERYALPDSLAASPNRENAMAAVLAARLAGCGVDAVREGLSRFRRADHRLALVAEINGVAYYDDSKATNIGAVKSALDGMARPVVLIAGGRDKGGDYRYLLDSMRGRVKRVVLIGEARRKMADALSGDVEISMAETLADAVRQAAQVAVAGDAVLLSPACASFDMFRSYADRGEQFVNEVNRLRGNQ